MEATAETAWEAQEGEEWELRHDDDGFIYKILKRRRLDEPDSSTAASQVTDPAAEERQRRERKRKTLLKLKRRYQKEIEQWELLSNSLRESQERANRQLELQKRQQEGEQATTSLQSPDMAVERTEDGYGSVIDELLRQAEAQEAIINDISNLCDIAEAMCNAQQEQLAQSFIDLPIWSSPRELMASLCDE